MRIISGTLRNRKIKSIDSLNTRPTLDRVKESLFNMLGQYFESGGILDVFGGSGNISFEAISRGIAYADINELALDALEVIKENAQSLGVSEKIKLTNYDYNDLLHKVQDQYDLINLDPPYNMEVINECLEIIFKRKLLKNSGYIICETEIDYITDEYFNIFKKKKIGRVFVTILEVKE